MKNLISFIFLLFSILFTGCSDQTDNISDDQVALLDTYDIEINNTTNMSHSDFSSGTLINIDSIYKIDYDSNTFQHFYNAKMLVIVHVANDGLNKRLSFKTSAPKFYIVYNLSYDGSSVFPNGYFHSKFNIYKNGALLTQKEFTFDPEVSNEFSINIE